MVQIDRLAEFYKPVDIAAVTERVIQQLDNRGISQPPEMVRATIAELSQTARITYYIPLLALHQLIT